MTSQPPTAVTHELSSAVIAVVLHVAGAVVIKVCPHAIDAPQRQVSARIADVCLDVPLDEKDQAERVASTCSPDDRP